ncbi:MAG TPA: hypothetical protein PKZ40_03470 [Anaerolineaceae bacterium]|nr:hypothetical protein [Anaerolineaceae bacterium]
MTIQDLQACRCIRSEIESLEERILRLRSQAERTTRQLSKTPRGEQRDYLANYVARLDGLERQLAAKVIALEEHLAGVDRWIEQLPEQQAMVMRARYVEGLKWWQVAIQTSYSMAHCKTINTTIKQKLNTK